MKTDFKSICHPLSNDIIINADRYLYFGGTAYLGIPQNENVINLYIEGIKKYGLNNGTSRNNNIQLGIYNEAEKFVAALFGAPDALITSSGYLAAQLAVKELSTFGEIIYAPNTHPALWQTKPPLITGSFADWATATIQKINTADEESWVIISNAMNNLFPEVYNFNFLKAVLPHKNIVLIVDDSHGIGINNNGEGAYKTLTKLQNVENVVVASMAKALGIDAGLVLASTKIIKQLKSTNEFVGASPPAAAGLHAFIHSQEIYQTQWQKLQQNIGFFSSKMPNHVKYAQGFPAFLIDDDEIAKKLLEHQILISSFPYPNANSKPINRIVLSSLHSTAEIEKLLKLLS